jgi:hypothetical protein
MQVIYDPVTQSPLLFLETDLDSGFHRSLQQILQRVAPEYHHYVIGNVTDFLTRAKPHVLIQNDAVHLGSHHSGKPAPTFSLTRDGYVPHEAYVHPNKFITDSGGRIVGREPNYYIPELDRGPHRIQTAIGVLDQHVTMPENSMPRIGIFSGLEFHGDLKQITNDYLHPDSLAHVKAGRHLQLPGTVKSFIRLHELPGKTH